MFTRSLLASALIILIAACAGEEGRQSDSMEVDRDTLTRRQKDSIVAELPIPGSGAVGRALKAQDAAHARAARHDSLAGGR